MSDVPHRIRLRNGIRTANGITGETEPTYCEYVLAEAYDALLAERADWRVKAEHATKREERLRAERDRLRREWQRECEDTNLLLQGLGLSPSEHRSEGGSLLHGRILHTVRKVRDDRDRLAAELTEARGLLRAWLEWGSQYLVYVIADSDHPVTDLVMRTDAVFSSTKGAGNARVQDESL